MKHVLGYEFSGKQIFKVLFEEEASRLLEVALKDAISYLDEESSVSYGMGDRSMGCLESNCAIIFKRCLNDDQTLNADVLNIVAGYVYMNLFVYEDHRIGVEGFGQLFKEELKAIDSICQGPEYIEPYKELEPFFMSKLNHVMADYLAGLTRVSPAFFLSDEYKA